jgi:inosine/xanthosine triphosphatase
MSTIVIAVGSTRRPKLDAVREALSALGPKVRVGADFEVVGMDVSSGVRHTPLSREETMSGARNRVEEIRRIASDQGKPWNFFVGLEGGIDVVRENNVRWTFLENWAYVSDVAGRGAFGQSGAILLPELLAKRILDDGVELADAIDAYAGLTGVRDSQGAWGVLTRGLITRQESYRIALISAFASLPFLGSLLNEREAGRI